MISCSNCFFLKEVFMKYIETFSLWLETHIGIEQEIWQAFLLTLISLVGINLLKAIFKNIFMLLEQRKAYLYYQRVNILLTILNIGIIFFLWDKYLGNIVTIISFTSAALTLALREFIFDFFAGLYIKIKKPFAIEDRIEIDGTTGDVISMGAFTFDLLEVGDTVHQSTGVIVTIPNTLVFTSKIKNLEKNFKYVWSEITVKTSLEADVSKTKEKLLTIIKENEVVKRIPKKMESEMDDISPEYRIYYNKLDPIVYVKVVDGHIEFYIRYLVHPKKNRYVEDEVWRKILDLYHAKEIPLYQE